LNPGSQELDRNRDLDRLRFEAFELERVKPAQEDVIAEPCAQHGARLLALRFTARLLVQSTVGRARKCAARNGTFRLLNRLH
jgi:hypothetical protein